MGCGACWDEACREKGDVVRGGWADVARRLPASSSVWVGKRRVLDVNDLNEWIEKQKTAGIKQDKEGLREAAA